MKKLLGDNSPPGRRPANGAPRPKTPESSLANRDSSESTPEKLIPPVCRKRHEYPTSVQGVKPVTLGSAAICSVIGPACVALTCKAPRTLSKSQSVPGVEPEAL